MSELDEQPSGEPSVVAPETDNQRTDNQRTDDQPTDDPQTTGNPHVDEVLRTLGTLEERPVAEHVAVFEAAQTALRDALSNRDDHSA